MFDYSELKRAAEIASLIAGDIDFELAAVNTQAATQEQVDAAASLMSFADPQSILALIGESERYRQYGCGTCDGSGHLSRADGEYFGACTSCGAYELEQAKRERDQLKAENEQLRALPQDWLAADLVKQLVDRAQAIRGNADGEIHDFAIVLLASAERLTRQEAVIDRLRAESEALRKDKDRIDAIEANCWDVRYDSSPNADAGDSNISIEIVGHFMAEPHERVVGENYSENLRAAIDQAMAADAYPPARPEYDEPDDIGDLFVGGSGNKARRRAEALGIDYDTAMGKGEQAHE